jgi:hypothetical protein
MLFIEPCLPMISRTVPTGGGWAYEIKHDGFRHEAAQRRADVVAVRAVLDQITNGLSVSFKRVFEAPLAGRVPPIDVVLTAHFHAERTGELSYRPGYSHYEQYFNYGNHVTEALAIELKPTVSDDYPAALRQMRANGAAILLLREYTGRGATRQQFVQTFATAGKRVVFLDEVRGISA